MALPNLSSDAAPVPVAESSTPPAVAAGSAPPPDAASSGRVDQPSSSPKGDAHPDVEDSSAPPSDEAVQTADMPSRENLCPFATRPESLSEHDAAGRPNPLSEREGQQQYVRPRRLITANYTMHDNADATALLNANNLYIMLVEKALELSHLPHQ